MRRPVLIPRELLRAHRPRAPPAHVIPHAVVHDPVLAAVRAGREARVADAVRLLLRVLVEDAAVVVLLPVLRVHRVRADELELAEAVVPVVAAGGAVDDEFLAGVRVGELLGAFVGGEAVVLAPTVGGLFPGVFRGGDLRTGVSVAWLWVESGAAYDLSVGQVRGHGPGVAHFGDAQVGWPRGEGVVPGKDKSAMKILKLFH